MKGQTHYHWMLASSSVSQKRTLLGDGGGVCFTAHQTYVQKGCSEDSCTGLEFSVTVERHLALSYDHRCCYTEHCSKEPIKGEYSCLWTSTICPVSPLLFRGLISLCWGTALMLVFPLYTALRSLEMVWVTHRPFSCEVDWVGVRWQELVLGIFSNVHLMA
jgi:hypothetical protein